MVSLLQNYRGNIEVDGLLEQGKPFHIILKSNTPRQEKVQKDNDKEYRITVKRYMTRKASPGFDFMAKMNEDVPMPLVTMVGKKIKETKGLVYMQLHGFGEATITCMCCGKELTNPISRHYGIGPVCMSKVGIVADIEDVDTIKEKLAELTWTGWIIKSAIIEEVEI